MDNVYTNISDLTRNGVRASLNTNYKSDLVKRFDLKTGDVVVRKINNLVCSGNAGNKMALNMLTVGSAELKLSSDIQFANVAGDLEHTYTATSDSEIAFFNLWVGPNVPSGFKVEFDLSITVNDVRYV